MIINMTGGGGGAALNFKVAPGLTQPGTASENTIWVKTEKISAWYFSATQPENMQEWDVWFTVGTSSAVEFNALKKNGIQVYPISAKQYVNGALVSKGAKIYQNGAWGNEWWQGELYDTGDEYAYVTGGWDIVQSKTGYPIDSNTKKFDSYLFISVNNNKSAAFITKKKVDVSKYKTLKLSASSAVRFGISNNPTLPHDSWVASAIATNDVSGVLTLPTTGGQYYIWVGNYASALETKEIYKMWLE